MRFEVIYNYLHVAFHAASSSFSAQAESWRRERAASHQSTARLRSVRRVSRSEASAGAPLWSAARTATARATGVRFHQAPDLSSFPVALIAVNKPAQRQLSGQVAESVGYLLIHPGLDRLECGFAGDARVDPVCWCRYRPSSSGIHSDGCPRSRGMSQSIGPLHRHPKKQPQRNGLKVTFAASVIVVSVSSRLPAK
jgi:hypothetical protein